MEGGVRVDGNPQSVGCPGAVDPSGCQLTFSLMCSSSDGVYIWCGRNPESLEFSLGSSTGSPLEPGAGHGYLMASVDGEEPAFVCHDGMAWDSEQEVCGWLGFERSGLLLHAPAPWVRVRLPEGGRAADRVGALVMQPRCTTTGCTSFSSGCLRSDFAVYAACDGSRLPAPHRQLPACRGADPAEHAWCAGYGQLPLEV